MTTDTRSPVAPWQRLKPSRSALFLNNPHLNYRRSSPLRASFSPEVEQDLIQFSGSQILNVSGSAGEYDLFGAGQRSTDAALYSPFDLFHEDERISFPFPGGPNMSTHFGDLQQLRTKNGEFQWNGSTRVSHREPWGANYQATGEDFAESNLDCHFPPPLLPESEEINLPFTRSQNLRKCTSRTLHHDPTSKIQSSVQEDEGLTFIPDSLFARRRQDYRQSMFSSEVDYLKALESLESRVGLCLDDKKRLFSHNQGMRSIVTDSKEGINLHKNKDRFNPSADNITPGLDQFQETLGQSPVRLFQSTDQLEALPYSDIAWEAPVYSYDLGGLEGRLSGLNVKFQEHDDTMVLSGIPVSLVKLGPISSPSSSSVAASDETDTHPLLRSNLYKTELCRTWEETGGCRYATKCQVMF